MPLFQSISKVLGLIPADPPKVKKASSNPSRGRGDSSTSLAARLEAQRMSPNTRTQQWLANNSPEKKVVKFKKSSTPSVLGLKDGGITKHAHTPRSSIKSRNTHSIVESGSNFSSRKENLAEGRRKSGLWDLLMGVRFKSEDKAPVKRGTSTIISDSESIMEGSTLVENVIDTIEGDEFSYTDGPSNFEGQTLLTQDQKGNLKVQDEDGHIEDACEDDFSDFTDEEYFLFHKLNARGKEPIIHVSWKKDFRALRDILFTDDRSKAYINAVRAPEYHAQKALYNLIEVGQRARDARIMGTSPEKQIRRFLNEYFAWTMHDARLKRVPHIPVLTITVAHPNEPITGVVNRCTDRLHELGRQYRAAWLISDSDSDSNASESVGVGLGVSIPRYRRRLPTLFGIIVKSTAVGFVTYDSAIPGKEVRNMGVWNLTQEGQDLWHALAIAIFMVCARNYLLVLQREGELGGEVVESEDDPDA